MEKVINCDLWTVTEKERRTVICIAATLTHWKLHCTFIWCREKSLCLRPTYKALTVWRCMTNRFTLPTLGWITCLITVRGAQFTTNEQNTGLTEVVCHLRPQIFSDRIRLPLRRWRVVFHPWWRIKSDWFYRKRLNGIIIVRTLQWVLEHNIKRSRRTSYFLDVV